VGSGGSKTAEKRGLKVQSPIFAVGVVLQSKKRRFYVGKKYFNGRHVGKQKDGVFTDGL